MALPSGLLCLKRNIPEGENEKRIVAQLTLDNDLLKELNLKNVGL